MQRRFPASDMSARAETDVQKVDVLIIGAGPAGLACALGLLRAGVGVKIIDQKLERIRAGQADALLPRTIEVFESYGLKDPAFKGGALIYQQAEYHYDPEIDGVKFTRTFEPMATTDARYKVFIAKSQAMFEDILVDALREGGVLVDRPYKPLSIGFSTDERELNDPTAYPVTVKLVRADGGEGEVTVKAKYLVGADGAHSWTRKALGIEMEGQTTPRIWGAIDFHPSPESNFPDWRITTIVHTPFVNSFSIPREGDQVRLYTELGLEEHYIDRMTGRVDTTKFGPEKLLEYEHERRSFAQELIAFDKWYAESFSPDASRTIQKELNIDMNAPFAALRAFSGMLSGCEIRYAPSDIVAPEAYMPTALVPGKRMPPCALVRTADHAPVDVQDLCPSDGRFKLLVFAGNFVNDADTTRLECLAERLDTTLKRVAEGDIVSVACVLKTVGERKRCGDVPRVLRSHWTSVLEDTVCSPETEKAYDKFAIGEQGALVLVRPDGYVAAVAPLDEVQLVEEALLKVLVVPGQSV
ncbi:FAD binding domain-containing protein [Vararia minispora EC-137]|uniref:FAD binding domain-containing protein n=1 Tax=Vararia minispora EC-137 TaxID=1314806 RepID=A0ACB8Q7I7_9AGAM|nr:FAD binding domain-containing protein [Vararia minispora EC-137]